MLSIPLLLTLAAAQEMPSTPPTGTPPPSNAAPLPALPPPPVWESAPASPQEGTETAAPVPPPPTTQPANARPRVELQAALGLDVGGSSWQGDALGHGTLLLGLRLFRIVGLFGMARVGYGAVDQRLLTFLSVGLQGGYWFRDKYYPYLRLAGVHQHEESLPSAAQNPWGTLLGIGTGIRHRAGVVGSIGCDFLIHAGKRGALSVGPEVALSYLTYSSGPSLYGFVGLQLGGTLTLL